MSKKIGVALLFFLAFAGGIFALSKTRFNLLSEYLPSFVQIREEAKIDISMRVEEFQKGVEAVREAVTGDVIAPAPLKRMAPMRTVSELSRYGVIQETNDQRVQFGLPTLIEKGALNRAAELKMQDLFGKQYFDHVSPEGYGPSHWADTAGYKYRVIGENLALGGFESDADLVEAWMESPGHRENILKAEFQEIGVAVGKGNFEGDETWIAVQVFGKPLPNCPRPDAGLKAQIDALQAELDEMQAAITRLREEIDRKQAAGENANAEVKEHNRLVEEYNALVPVLKQTISAYNETVKAYNACIQG